MYWLILTIGLVCHLYGQSVLFLKCRDSRSLAEGVMMSAGGLVLAFTAIVLGKLP